MRQKYAIAAHVFLTNAHGEVLFMRRANTGYADGKWSVAAGHVEANETFVACALRELKEEAGLQLKPASLKPVLVQQKRDFDEQERVDIFFHAILPDGQTPIIGEPEKCDSVCWANPADPPENTIGYVAHALRHWASGDGSFIAYFGFDL